MFCTSCGTQAIDSSAFCGGCGKPAASATSAHAVEHPMKQPFASPRLDGDIPEGVKGWSWGAFLLSWIWAIGNRTWLGLLALVPYVGFFVAVWLGIKGREMAWKNKQWDSVEHFNRVQRRWSIWGLVLVLGVGVLGILAAIAIPAYHDYTVRARQAQAESSLVDEARTSGAAGQLAAESGMIDSNADSLPETLATVAGTLQRSSGADHSRFMTLDGQQLFHGDDAQWQFPVRKFALSEGREAVLMASSGGRGNSCETLYFFLVADTNGVTPTPMFGTCAPQGSFTQRGDVITLVLPKMGGHSVFAFNDGALQEDGQPVTLDGMNDPSK